jgi:hypothetical protein
LDIFFVPEGRQKKQPTITPTVLFCRPSGTENLIVALACPQDESPGLFSFSPSGTLIIIHFQAPDVLIPINIAEAEFAPLPGTFSSAELDRLAPFPL